MKKIIALLAAVLLGVAPAMAQVASPPIQIFGKSSGGTPACTAFGTTAGTCIQGGGAGGTPSSITLTNGAGLPLTTGVTGNLSPSNGGKPSNRYSANTFQNPTGTTSATKLMMGLGGTWALTPASTGRVRVTIVGWLTNSSAVSITQVLNVNYGTGTAPINGAALTGTAMLATDYSIGSGSTANIPVPFTFVAEVTGLTLSTPYWFDPNISSNDVATASLRVVYTTIEEF